MKRLFNVYDRVVPILRENPYTRDNDGLLIAQVDASIRPGVDQMSYGYVMRNRHALGLPTCESIRRARQKAFNEHPELSASKKVQDSRNVMEGEYIEFARSAIG